MPRKTDSVSLHLASFGNTEKRRPSLAFSHLEFQRQGSLAASVELK